MDVMTAFIADIDMGNRISAKSRFVAESKNSPHYASMMGMIETVSKRSSHLTEEELAQLERDKNDMFKRQVINRISNIDDLTYANKETVELGAIMSRHKEAFINGALSFTTAFTAPVVEVLAESAYSGTTGVRIKEDGTRDHTAKRTLVASTSSRLNDMANLSSADKARAIQATKVINESELDDPFHMWSDREISRSQTNTIGNVDIGAEQTVSAGGIDWSSLL